MLTDEERLVEIRSRSPERVAEALANRHRRPHVLNEHGRLFLLAADHTARGQFSVNGNHAAMADRNDLLRRLRVALERPGVDGILATADIIEDLALLGALEQKVVFGSMNRGGLAGSVFELDDRFTGYSASAIEQSRLDGGKMMARVADDDRVTAAVLEQCAHNINQLADRQIPAMVEVFSVHRFDGRVRPDLDPFRLARAVAIVSGLGNTSAYTWLKVPVMADIEQVAAATNLPLFLLGGDPSDGDVHKRWEQAMGLHQVRGLVAGRTLLYPTNGDLIGAVDEAAAIVASESAS
jgi:hypothetical protein